MFISKKIKILLTSLILIFFTIIIFFTVNYEFRRSFFTKVLVLHDFYRLKTMTHGLQVRDFEILSKKLNNYINASKKISKNKNYMLPGIYEATELVVSRAITQDDYNKIEEFLKNLIDLDDRIYKPHVWYARALSDNDYNLALEHLKLAIEISPSENEAYREILRIAQSLNDKDMANKYCEIYQNSFSGGEQPLHFGTLFNSYNNNKFSIKTIYNLKKETSSGILDITENDYLNSQILQNTKKLYEFIPTQIKDLNGINLYFSPLSGLKVNIQSIIYYSDNEYFVFKPKDLTITSNHSFIDQINEKLTIYLTQKIDEVIRVRHKNMKKIDKINILMKIEKMNIASDNLCYSNK